MKLNNNNELLCPACGSWQLVRTKTVFFYREPDASTTTKIVVTCEGKTKTTLVPSFDCGNPSPRGDGILHYYSCAPCSERFRLEEAHNKGAVEYQWCERGRRYEAGLVPLPEFQNMTEAELARAAIEMADYSGE
jgi:DNA-directed RNA polymerase subunit RPC12/RpoP